MMEWNFNNETPIYLQIIDRFKMDIANASYKRLCIHQRASQGKNAL